MRAGEGVKSLNCQITYTKRMTPKGKKKKKSTNRLIITFLAIYSSCYKKFLGIKLNDEGRKSLRGFHKLSLLLRLPQDTNCRQCDFFSDMFTIMNV